MVKSSPKSIFPAIGNSCSASCTLSGLIAVNISLRRSVVVMWFDEPSKQSDCCKIVRISSFEMFSFDSRRSCKQHKGAAAFNVAR